MVVVANRKIMSSEAQSQNNETKSEVNLKLVIDKKQKKILYGEADKAFVDFLFTILALPVGTVVKLLSSTGDNKLGSLSSLYRSVESLGANDFEADHLKDSLLKPELPATTGDSPIRSLLQIKSSVPSKTNYYTCNRLRAECRSNYFSAEYGATCPICRCEMTNPLSYVDGAGEARPVVGGYVKGGTATYMVMDDLTVLQPMPCSSTFLISLLKELKVENVEHIDEKIIYLNLQDGVNLLRASLQSSTVLTDIFLRRIDFSSYCYASHRLGKQCHKEVGRIVSLEERLHLRRGAFQRVTVLVVQVALRWTQFLDI